MVWYKGSSHGVDRFVYSHGRKLHVQQPESGNYTPTSKELFKQIRENLSEFDLVKLEQRYFVDRNTVAKKLKLAMAEFKNAKSDDAIDRLLEIITLAGAYDACVYLLDCYSPNKILYERMERRIKMRQYQSRYKK